jgi:ABC-type uncharacterized transport system auxiliary subunit
MSRWIIVALIGVIFSGCSLKDVSKPILKYTIDSNTEVKSQAQHVDKILKITNLKTPEYLQNSNIWFKKPSLEMSPYIYSKWNDDFENLIKQNISTAIYDSNIFKTIFTRSSKIRPDLVLEGEIVETMQVLNDDKSADVIFTIRLYLIDTKSSNLIGSKEFKYLQKSKSVDAKGAIIAYDEIVKKLNKDVVIWLRKLMKIK